MIIGEPVSFFFTSQGELTKSTWAGNFKVRPVLSFAGMAAVESERRVFLGNPIGGETVVSEDLRNIATMVAQIKYRIVDCPPWVRDSNYLADFIDGNTLIELFTKLMSVEDDYRKSLTKEAEAAKQEMKEPAQTK